MTWKPEGQGGWDYSNIERMLAEFEQKGFVDEPWRLRATRQAAVGDTVWLLKQGQGRRGIFGTGETTGLPLEGSYKGKTHMMVPVRFTHLVDPKRDMLIELADLRAILREQQINSQSSGITLSPDQAKALSGLLAGAHGQGDWSASEVRQTVEDYFDMLQHEVDKQSYSKTDHRRALRGSVHRSEGAIEFKHQNISAVLQELGLPWIEGYKPRGNRQELLARAVERRATGVKAQLDAFIPQPSPDATDPRSVFQPPPTVSLPADNGNGTRLAAKPDYVMRDARNRALGDAGETFAMEIEKRRLAEGGRPDLAAKVRQVSLESDGHGYDICSFETDGTAIFIDVKTTRGPASAPFFVSEGERRVASIKGGAYRIFRVYNFGPEPLIYVLAGPLEERLWMIPVGYKAMPR